MLNEIHKRQPLLTDYKVFDWGALNFGSGGARAFIVDSGYAIMGFWRGRGEQLIDLKYVLAGKGALSHGSDAFFSTVNFRQALRDKPASSS